jgi:hypothetical protein
VRYTYCDEQTARARCGDSAAHGSLRHRDHFRFLSQIGFELEPGRRGRWRERRHRRCCRRRGRPGPSESDDSQRAGRTGSCPAVAPTVDERDAADYSGERPLQRGLWVERGSWLEGRHPRHASATAGVRRRVDTAQRMKEGAFGALSACRPSTLFRRYRQRRGVDVLVVQRGPQGRATTNGGWQCDVPGAIRAHEKIRVARV